MIIAVAIEKTAIWIVYCLFVYSCPKSFTFCLTSLKEYGAYLSYKFPAVFETYKYIFIPVYSTAYMYKDKHYNVLINGETGKIKGEYPKSPIKIAAIIIVILGILFGIYLASSHEDTSYKRPHCWQFQPAPAFQWFLLLSVPYSYPDCEAW